MNLDLFQPMPCPRCGGDGIYRDKPCAVCGGPGTIYRKVGAGVVLGLDSKGDPAAQPHVIVVPPASPFAPSEETTIEVRREYGVH